DKTAAKLLQQYGSLEGIYAALDDQSPRLRQNLAESHEQVFLNRELMKLVDDVTLDVDTEDLRRGEWEQAAVKDLFESLEFYSLWEDLLEVQPTAGDLPAEVLEVDTQLVTDPAAVARLADQERLVVDLVVSDGEPFGLAVAVDHEAAAVVPFDALGPLAPALADPEKPVVGHDLKETVRTLMELGYEVEGLEMDTALAAYVLNPSSRNYELTEVADRDLRVQSESPHREEPDQGTPYDSRPARDLEGRRVPAIERLAVQLRSEPEARDEVALFERFELPLVTVLARMELAG